MASPQRQSSSPDRARDHSARSNGAARAPAHLGPGAHVGPGAHLGPAAHLGPGAHVGPAAGFGPGANLGPAASPEDLLRLQRSVGNRAVGRLLQGATPPPATPRLSRRAPLVQRLPEANRINGVTHLVRMRDLSLFEGEEGEELGDGNDIEIDTDVTHLSRRGPNQEVFREHDRVGEVAYLWYKVLEVRGVPAEEGTYVREDALAVPPGAGQTGETGKTGQTGQTGETEPIRQGGGGEKRVRGQNVAIGVPFTVQELLDRAGVAWKSIRTQLETLEQRGLLLCLERDSKAPLKSRYVAQHGIEEALAETKEIPVKPKKTEEGEQGKGDEDQEVLGTREVPAFNEKLARGLRATIYSAPNLREKAEGLSTTPELSATQDWFSSMSTMLTLLASRKDVAEKEMVKLIRLELTRYQLQATYGIEDTLRTGRQTSPLVNEGYARGIKTGLWEMSKSVLLGRLVDQVAAAAKKDKKAVASELKKINVFPASRPFTYDNRVPEVVETAPGDTATKPALFITSLKLQTMKPRGSQSKEEGGVNSFMGGRGLRTSPSESAEFVAEELARLIGAGKLAEALAVVSAGIRQNKTFKGLGDTFEQVNFSTNMLVAPEGIDPLRQSQPALVKALASAYADLMQLRTRDLPFLFHQNLEVVDNLCTKGGSRGVEDFFDTGTPTTVTAGMIDACERAREAAGRYERMQASRMLYDELPNTDEPHNLVEEFYQHLQDIHHAIRFQLDWKGDKTSIHDALTAMLPGGTGLVPTSTQVAPHGLATLDQIHSSLPSQDSGSVAILSGAYYETPELFPGAQEKQGVDDVDLKSMRVIVMEPHPNNAKAEKIIPHDPLKLLDNLYGTDTGKHTVIMDVTLNHLGESQIQQVLTKAEPYIDDGRLNLVLVQSGTKFLQHGMDLVNIGLSVVFNDGTSWGEFNSNMAAQKDLVPDQDKIYIANLLSQNKEPLGAYLEKIRANTLLLSGRLRQELGKEDNAFELTVNEDPETVYLAIKPKNGFVQKVTTAGLDDETRTKVNQAVYSKHLLPALRGLPIIKRDSFGFNLTNLGECLTTIRITLGVEEEGLLEAYCEMIAAVGRDLWAHPEVVKLA